MLTALALLVAMQVPSPKITIDISPAVVKTEVRVYSDTLEQWFDWSTNKFAATPVKLGQPLVANAKNKFARNASFVLLEPGEYRVYVFLMTTRLVAGIPTEVPEDDFYAVEAMTVGPDRHSQTVHISVTQPR